MRTALIEAVLPQRRLLPVKDQFRPPKTFADELALEETQKGSRNV